MNEIMKCECGKECGFLRGNPTRGKNNWLMEKRIDIDAIEKEWTDFVNSKKFNVNEFAYNVQPMIAELKRLYGFPQELDASLRLEKLCLLRRVH